MVVSADKSGAERRIHERTDTERQASLTVGPDSIDCSIIDISSGGCRIRIIGSPARRTPVSLKIGGLGVVGARVAWVAPGSCGLSFEDDPEMVAELLVAVATYG